MTNLREKLRELVYTYTDGHTSDEDTISAILQAFKEVVPGEKPSPKGMDCSCEARYYGDCGCGVSWDDNDMWNQCRKEILEGLK